MCLAFWSFTLSTIVALPDGAGGGGGQVSDAGILANVRGSVSAEAVFAEGH